MPKIRKIWRVIPANLRLRKEMSDSLGVSEIISQVLINRGITDQKIAKDFLLGGSEKLEDPYLLKDMDKAVSRIAKAIDHQEKIIIYGDYDVDGMTSSALLMRVLTDLGGNVDYYIPDRQTEGYGLNGDALEFLAETGTDLLITVDCGISALLEIEHIKRRLDVIITDHHQPPEQLPDAYGIINPKQQGCSYPEKNLAGVGVAFKLCQGLWQHYHGRDYIFLEYLDIVAIGTVADIVSLTGENRILVKLGLEAIAATKNTGLLALLEVCSIDQHKMDTGKIGFGIAPRLNAAGRMNSAKYGVELLITQDKARAQELATQLNDENTQRQAVEKEIQEAAEKLVSEMDIKETKVLVLAGENWHSGVIGIVASRLVDKYFRPVIIISIHEGMGKASCRSIPAFDIYNALHQCSDLLVKFGGHHQAAGLSILPENIDEFRNRLTSIATQCLTPEDYTPILTIDSVVSLNEMNLNFLKELEYLKPYGMGNPSPVLACEKVELKNVRTLGQEAQHLKLKVAQNNSIHDVVAWRLGELADGLQGQKEVDVAFIPEVNEWQGRCSVQLRAHDVQSISTTELDQLYALYSHKQPLENSYEDCFIKNEARKNSTRKLFFEDGRHFEDKLAYILNILQGKEKTIIIAHTPQDVYEVAREIRRALPQRREEIGFYHSGLDLQWKTKMENWFAEDRLTIMVGTNQWMNQCYSQKNRHTVLYNVPFTENHFREQCNLGWEQESSNTVHLLFNKHDYDKNTLLLGELWPERLVVGQVYLTLKKQQGNIVPDDLASLVLKQYKLSLSSYSITVALKILEELQLLQYIIKGHKKVIELLAEPMEKLDIEQSATFRQGLLIKQESVEFAKKIMDISLEELVIQRNEG